jgi:hypothetical protein
MLTSSLGMARKLKGKSMAELFVRSSQIVSATVERSALSRAGREPSLATACVNVDAGRRGVHMPRLSTAFPGLADLAASADAIRQRWPLSIPELIARADAVATGHFHLLGHSDLFFGDPIDWHLDPTTGNRAPREHWSRIRYLDVSVVGDHKVVWELNRHQHFLTLGQAYCLTGNDRYALAFTRQLISWMDENPPTRGVNWASSLEVSFRAIAWIWALALFRNSCHLTDAVRARAVAVLHAHGLHIERYLSTYFSPNTHLTGEALGLVYLGTFLPQLRRARRWRRLGWRILTEQIKRHVRADGVYFEQASYYQRYTADFYLQLLRLGVAADVDTRDIVGPLEALVEHLMHLQRPDGTTPFIGDDDGGRLLPLDGRAPNDFRSTLASAAVVLDRADFREVAGAATRELVWLLGPAGLRRFENMRGADLPAPSRAFPEGGYFISRDRWTADANYSVIDCGPLGSDNCGHAHADALAIELAARGRTMLVDPGTFTYTTDLAERDRFRATEAHNTITIDNDSSSTMAGPFHWSHVALASARTWYSTSRFDFFDGAHDGFRHHGASHARSVFFLRGDYWIVRDRIESNDPHDVVARYQCAAGVDVSLKGPADATLGEGEDGSPRMLLSAHASVAGQLGVEQGWVSPAYGVKLPAPRCAFRIGQATNAEILTALVPFSADSAPVCVSSVSSSGALALRIRVDATEDLWLVGENVGSTACDLESDARWTWVRRDIVTGDVRELILIDGQRVRLGGEMLCELGVRARWFSARRVAAGWLVEADGINGQIRTTLYSGAPSCAASAV